MKAYCASGWFSPAQEQSRLDVISAILESGMTVYSPKDDMLYAPGEQAPSDVFLENCRQIEDSDLVVVSTEGKDLGTIFEAGFAHAINVPIVYYWKGGTGKFNLMLAESGTATFTNKDELTQYLCMCQQNDDVFKVDYQGEQE